jgi:molybdate transport system substrate-binding protein
VCTNRASGDHFVKVLERLGIIDAVRAKLSRLEPDDVFVKVLAGKGNDFAVGTITQIKSTAGLKLVGPLPGDLQSNIPYAASVTAGTKVADIANAFVSYVSSAKSKAEFVAAGGE